MTERAKIERLRRLLQRRKLLFVKVGARAGEDMVIPTHLERDRDGATISNPSYNQLLRDIMKALE